MASSTVVVSSNPKPAEFSNFMYCSLSWEKLCWYMKLTLDIQSKCGLASAEILLYLLLARHSCPSGYVKSPYGQRLGCNAINSVDKCKRNSFVALTGYDSVFDAYNPKPLKVLLSDCKVQCLKDCNCDGFTYDTNTSLCYKTGQVLSLRKVPGTSKLAYVKL